MISNVFRQRIERLVKELRVTDLRYWTYADWVDECCLVPNDPEYPDDGYNLPECGTVACALGRACLIPEFQAVGMSLSIVGTMTFEPRYTESGGDIHCGIEAAVKFFGIDVDDARSIFVYANYEDEAENLFNVSPTDVADMLDLYLKRNGGK
jgi:hypothetical protein